MSKKKKSPASRSASSKAKVVEKPISEAERLFKTGDYAGARAACGEDDGDVADRLAVDPIFYKIYAGGLALLGVLAALTMR